jgi:hypothetical protein
VEPEPRRQRPDSTRCRHPRRPRLQPYSHWVRDSGVRGRREGRGRDKGWVETEENETFGGGGDGCAYKGAGGWQACNYWPPVTRGMMHACVRRPYVHLRVYCTCYVICSRGINHWVRILIYCVMSKL